MKKSAFTLIELLVVIAIIAILAAILFPVFARARAKAQQTHCLNNVKQIAMAEKMYASDYGDRWAPWNCDSRYYYLNPYMGIQNITGRVPTAAEIRDRWQLWKCPSTAPPWSDYHVSYSLNDYGDGNYSLCWFVRADSEIPDPANVIMWGDGGWNLGFNAQGVPNTCNTRVMQGVWWPPSTPALDAGLTNDPPFWPWRTATMQFSFIGRHNGLCNVNYCDGHAKAIDLAQMRNDTITVFLTYWGGNYRVYKQLTHVRSQNTGY